MRTKTLLAAAILAAGVATSMAQSNVYSLNVVGYVNKSYTPGYHIIANPLQATNNSIVNILPNAPLFSVCYKFVSGSFVPNNYLGGWTDTSMQLNPGEGAFLYIPAGPNYTNTYVGEVLQGNLTNALGAGYNLVGTMVPQAGGITSVHNLQPALFDVAYLWNDPGQSYDPYNYLAGWTPSEPSAVVGEGFFYYSGGANTWVRNFSVPTP